MENAETRGQIATKAYYQSLQNVEANTYDALKANFEEINNLMANSSLDKNSDEWHNLQNEIEETNIAMQESLNKIVDLDKKMRQVDWDLFDFVRGQENQFTEEIDFLVDLLSGNKMYDDNGNITDKGLATMGLHAQGYNAYMEQAIKYTIELKRVQKELEEAPTDTNLINRYNELVERQQEAILSSESLKESMENLAAEGIEKHKNSMRDLIDSYLEASESVRDLYSWQKKSGEYSKRIASLQKQLAAYSGDSSEEARSLTQKIQMELQNETDNYEEELYSRYLDSQREILNSIYNEYEQALNNCLSDTTTVISDAINRVNGSNETINSSIRYKDESGVVNVFTEGDEVICCVGENDRYEGKISRIGYYQENEESETECAMYIDTSTSRTSYSREIVKLADITYICKNPLKDEIEVIDKSELEKKEFVGIIIDLGYSNALAEKYWTAMKKFRDLYGVSADKALACAVYSLMHNCGLIKAIKDICGIDIIRTECLLAPIYRNSAQSWRKAYASLGSLIKTIERSSKT